LKLGDGRASNEFEVQCPLLAESESGMSTRSASPTMATTAVNLSVAHADELAPAFHRPPQANADDN